MTPHSETPTNAMNASEGKEVNDFTHHNDSYLLEAPEWFRAFMRRYRIAPTDFDTIAQMFRDAHEERLQLREQTATQAATIASLQATIAEMRDALGKEISHMRRMGRSTRALGSHSLADIYHDCANRTGEALASPSTGSREEPK